MLNLYWTQNIPLMLLDFSSKSRFSLSPRWPFLVSSHPQLSKSPRLQFLVRVYMTPAELMAWKNAVSLFAVIRNKHWNECHFIYLVYEISCSVYAGKILVHVTFTNILSKSRFTQMPSIHLSRDGFWLLFPLHQTESSAVGLLSYTCIVGPGSALDCDRSPLWHLRNA